MRSVATGQADQSLARLSTTRGASGGMVVIARDGGVERSELGRAVRGESDLPPPVVRA
jgi:DNA-binding phage protein